ncbi:MAG TPA: PaaI family thioesterase [bacterium]|nr:PaaI family thioesterase [bacterium]
MPDPVLADPRYEQVARAMFEGQPFMAHIGAELGAVRPGYAEIHLPYSEAVTQHNGFFHGGVIATLADNSGGAAGYTLLPPGKGLLTVEFKVNILAPGRGERLIARGRVVRPGRSLFVSASEVYAVREGQETLCATELMTLMVVDKPD